MDNFNFQFWQAVSTDSTRTTYENTKRKPEGRTDMRASWGIREPAIFPSTNAVNSKEWGRQHSYIPVGQKTAHNHPDLHL